MELTAKNSQTESFCLEEQEALISEVQINMTR